MAQHTPGPWTHEGTPITGFYIDSANGDEVCEFHQKAYNEANARLIAAAPDMLEQLQAVLLRLDLEAAEHPGSTFPCAAMRDDIRAVIARATG